MINDTAQSNDTNLDMPLGSVVQVRGGPNSGVPEISTLGDPAGSTVTDLDVTPPYVDSAMQRQFDQAVDLCRAVNNGHGYFYRYKSNLAKALNPSFDLYYAVKACPDLVHQLR